MGIRKYWVLECDNESERDPNRHRQIAVALDDDKGIQRWMEARGPEEHAKLGSEWQWGVIPVCDEAGKLIQRACICPSCRTGARLQQNPERFKYPVPEPIVDTSEHPIPKPIQCLYILPCGHQFADKLSPEPVDGKWECTACVLAWLNSGNLDEIPPRIQGMIEKIKAKYREQSL